MDGFSIHSHLAAMPRMEEQQQMQLLRLQTQVQD